MLSREKRLVKNRDFERVYQRGKRVGAEAFNLNFAANRLDLSRVGVVVGKKFSKKAVERNKAKRIFREAVKDIYGNIVPGYDVVLFVKKTNTPMKLETAKAELKKALVKGGLSK